MQWAAAYSAVSLVAADIDSALVAVEEQTRLTWFGKRVVYENNNGSESQSNRGLTCIVSFGKLAVLIVSEAVF